MDDGVLTELDGDVWRITLDRPDTGNALDPDFAAALAAAVRSLPESARAVLILANGPRFCVGGDVQSFAHAEHLAATVSELAQDWHDVIRVVLACPVPVLAGAQGAVAG